MYTYKATVIDVHDGDTVTAVVELGFHITTTIKIRFLGINAPELRGETRQDAVKSRLRLVSLILGKEVILKTHRDKQEKFGRWLGEIFINENDTKSVNQMLIDEGLAAPFMIE
jgi:micrococcal nuclease